VRPEVNVSATGEPEDKEQQGSRDERDTHSPFSRFAQRFGRTAPKSDARLTSNESLHRNPRHSQNKRQAEQTRAHADAKLIHAYPKPEVHDGESTGPCKKLKAPLIAVFSIPLQENEQPRDAEHEDRGVARDRPEHTPDPGPRQESHDRRAGLEPSKDEADSEPLAAWKARDPERSAENKGVDGQRDHQQGEEQRGRRHPTMLGNSSHRRGVG
jgi:hypothetical protein